jgi:hypothetical protein
MLRLTAGANALFNMRLDVRFVWMSGGGAVGSCMTLKSCIGNMFCDCGAGGFFLGANC